MTFSYCAAIEPTLEQLSAISVPVSSAVNPPNDGTTSPPPARIALMSEPNDDEAMGMPVSPFQNTVQEPLLAAWMKAMVRYLLPDCWASPDRLSPLYASKYGAKTWAGSGVPAAAWATDAMVKAAQPATRAAAAAATRSRRDRRMAASSRVGLAGGS